MESLNDVTQTSWLHHCWGISVLIMSGVAREASRGPGCAKGLPQGEGKRERSAAEWWAERMFQFAASSLIIMNIY